MKIVAACSTPQEAQSVFARLQQGGLQPYIHEVHQNAWRKVPVPIHVSVPPYQSEAAFKLVKDSFPHLAFVADEQFCPACRKAEVAAKPFTLTLVKALWLIPKVRLLGHTFCPACHCTWRPGRQ